MEMSAITITLLTFALAMVLQAIAAGVWVGTIRTEIKHLQDMAKRQETSTERDDGRILGAVAKLEEKVDQGTSELEIKVDRSAAATNQLGVDINQRLEDSFAYWGGVLSNIIKQVDSHSIEIYRIKKHIGAESNERFPAVVIPPPRPGTRPAGVTNASGRASTTGDFPRVPAPRESGDDPRRDRDR